MKKLFVFAVLLLVGHFGAYATHVRAGELSYTYIGNNTFRVQVRTYTEIGGVSGGADQDRLPIDWGDGTPTDTIFRKSKETVRSGSGYTIQENIYEKNHTYSGFGTFVIGVQDVNRIAGIDNIGSGISDQISLYVEDSLFFRDPSIYGPVNSSPILPSLAIDFAQVNEIFHHIPAAYDPDGDSLAYEFYNPLQDRNSPVPNWQLPNVIDTRPTTFTLDPVTGVITWNFPTYRGKVNVGLRIKEYRKRYEGDVAEYFLMGSYMRDLHIIIDDFRNNPPVIKAIHDTCIIAGAHLVIPIIATDPDAGQKINLKAFGGPFSVTKSPATFKQTLKVTDSSVAILDWQTVCDHSDADYYNILIKATDNPNDSLYSLSTFRIKVVAPPPQNLTANAVGNAVLLNWDNPYACDGTNAERFLGFSIWRREGSNQFAIDTCTPGLAGRGYVKITTGVKAYTYRDNNVQIGHDYCYRILAEFGATTSLGYVVHFVQSLPSNEACSHLKKDIPVITKASVNTTDLANGSVRVEWSNPDPTLLDTLQYPPPYKFEILSDTGFVIGNNPRLIKTFTYNSFAVLDTGYTDTLLNTKSHANCYAIKFYSKDSLLGQTQNASTVFLSIASAGGQLGLTWAQDVPWTNDSYIIYRQNKVSQLFDSIGTSLTQSYADKGLTNDSVYCYKVKSLGHYSAEGFQNPLINFSQENCASPVDTVGPCPPVLIVDNQCLNAAFAYGATANLLSWSKPAKDCGGDAIKYYLYYAPDKTSDFALIDSLHLLNDTTFLHELNNTISGCYAVAAVDSYYNVGAKSIVVCVDNCPLYNLPNTFTPNDDAKNDLYVPIAPYRFIDRVNMKIFTSWGNLVFETHDPAIKWDGRIASSNKEAPEGTYYYICEVFEVKLNGDDKPSKTLNGFIHLYR